MLAKAFLSYFLPSVGRRFDPGGGQWVLWNGGGVRVSS